MTGLFVAALVVGVVVGLTGMGGGALMTPMLVLGFGVPPLTAVSSDIIASTFMKPVGSWVHIRRGTVNWKLVKLLVLGSVPSAFFGVLLVQLFGSDASIQAFVKKALGVALLLAAAGLGARAYMRLRERAQARDASADPLPTERPDPEPRVLPTILVGIVGGLMVGLTSVGSGSLIIIALMALYPTLRASQLVGTDLVQAVPLVLAAAAGHLLFGDVDWSVAIPVILGSVPGAFIGAQISSRVGGAPVRRALAFVLLFSGLAMLGVPALAAVCVVLTAAALTPVVWIVLRHQQGFTPFWWQERRAERERIVGMDAQAEPDRRDP
ncbi:sulfite exporter TauE/SafE family protein [Demequina capsici]|uniref:Probable membrane transporter protein n=1 Tax=Demequina capsici TaxID=3075620 RepID=A0AA96F5T0_9MICO|nr:MULTISPECIES: sulfite exporter TauE/SafE family protein [unclassified Demequina]WNM24348.1 sulfite exporter TauE/SafE family protein [Demequina sp. OYTSA14]WNM27170.1 sulfite exporter TauE/SafE family protein [Demequina sp. PMTSA13]